MLPSYRQPQKAENNLEARARVKGKLDRFIERGYLGPGEVKSLVNYFSVPKGEDDIRVVFDGSKFGLNTALWAPPFALPTVDSLLPTLDIGTWHGDIDVREMFYNYLLDPEIQPFCSLHANPYFQETSNQQPLAWVHWQHCVMGLNHMVVLKCSLWQRRYSGVILQGKCNPLYSGKIIPNLPGSSKYNPSKAWLYKYDSSTKVVVCDMATYMDDL